LYDIRDITPGPASHPYQLDVRGEKTLVFTFDNILLPDSTTNEQASHGYIFFDIALPDLPSPFDLVNDASIFFDFNSPIITNEVLTIIDFWLATENLSDINHIDLSPNPAQGFSTLLLDLKKSATVSIELIDITENVAEMAIQNQVIAAGENKIDINTSYVPNGIYMVKINVDNEVITKKLVVVR